ncbi:aminotransferase class I/II-fold pyridoxal phosphate-dependent enzyme [Sphingomonas nostoxanthinifaciens]|uniref:aminotransferase class I/II-fold pyridoxal phosphate-dependent enzyme n=1 Tax=Sphingomonas nostoxanthinifaciens TaxID=2872652 RepID=UPI001CC1DD62|nr:aminotransferase class I/II-fold pyridoxal phosphate-dependent enzyme [Sphingomonas nostoxanthinifaciens]UAK24481.1 aminotransferase class I/II-fold pyridoxal phosphate-dependent enzyme [Sphingomonas nostoxanthinifaciens]
MPSLLDPFLQQALDAAAARGERRALVPTALVPGGRVARDGRTLLDFSSNDYLGLATHPLLAERGAEWARRHGSSAGASRLVTGTHELHLAVEARVAAFKGTPAALLFASGWQANAAILPALAKALPGLTVFADRLNHASLHHGCAAAGLRQVRFRHNDLDHLDALLAVAPEGPKLVLTESVFSMDGDRVDLPRLTAIARAHGAFTYLDEAHATGVLGPRGAGLSATVPGAVDLVMGTFSKALGGFGAYVAGSVALCDYLVNACGGIIYTTALPPGVLGAIDAALDLVPAMDAERAALADMAARLRALLAAGGIDTAESSTQIVPAIVGEAEAALAAARSLEAEGMLAIAIRPPTVPRGRSRLRIALRASHSSDAIDGLAAAVLRAVA